jgi:tRNA(fMet)-specific endonuclease VapC
MPYLLDTDWAIQAFGGREPATATLRRFARLGVAVSRITFAELYHGAHMSINPQASTVEIRDFLSPYQQVEISDRIKERFGEIRAELQRRGELIGDFDILIAATAIEHDLTLLTFNRRHYERVPGLRMYQPE